MQIRVMAASSATRKSYLVARQEDTGQSICLNMYRHIPYLFRIMSNEAVICPCLLSALINSLCEYICWQDRCQTACPFSDTFQLVGCDPNPDLDNSVCHK